MTDNSQPSWIEEHINLYKTDPEKAHYWDFSPMGGPGKLPTLLLETHGRKSGKARFTPLIYRNYGNGYTIIASKGGSENHPLWYLNLEAKPECKLKVGPKDVLAKARVAEGTEREEIWQKMVGIFEGFVSYQEATDRKIPVLVLDPY